MANQLKIFLMIILSLCCLVLFWIYYPDLFPVAALDIRFSRDQIRLIAEEHIREWGYSTKDYHFEQRLQTDKDVLRFAQNRYKGEELRKIIAEDYPVYYWGMSWREVKKNGADSTRLAVTEAAPFEIKSINLNLDQNGDVLAFYVQVADDSAIASLDAVAARIKADSVLYAKLGPDVDQYTLANHKQTISGERIDYSFIYRKEGKNSDIQTTIQIDLVGRYATGFKYVFDVPDIKQSYIDDIREISAFILILILTVLAITVFIQKIRSNEVSFKAALPVTLFLTLTYVALILLHGVDWTKVISAAVSAPLVGFFALLFVACTDAVTREIWNDKLLTCDSVRRGRFRHRLFALSLLRGVLYGSILLGILIVILKITDIVSYFDTVDWNVYIDDLNSPSPILFRFVRVVNKVIWTQIILLLFVTSYFTRLLKRTNWIFAIIAFLWGIDILFTDQLPAYPFWASFLRSAAWGLVMAALLIRYDFLTAVFAHFIALLLLDAVRFYHFDHPSYVIAGLVYAIVVLGLVIFALSSLRRNISAEELSTYAPAYVSRIIERERLARELEIARQVQLGFLPRSNPSIPELDIASVCLPAQEVGGDYYDFIRLPDDRLGVAIGDVSGKGISAAFYMTLTKGFLRSMTRTSLSPRQILVEINSLFYENVERGHFISMIYGVFDLKHHIFTFARAGHNPVICYQKKQRQSRLLCPRGIALGLDQGDIFSDVIKEESLSMLQGDTLIFYTDGFSEAMNNRYQEFGEARIQEIIDSNSRHNAGQLLLSIEKQLKSFVGSTAQHDDMTMVIVQAT